MLVVQLNSEQEFLDLLSSVESDQQKFKYTEFSLDSWQQAFNYKINESGKFIKMPTKKPKEYPCILVMNHRHGSRIKHLFIDVNSFSNINDNVILEC